MAKYLIILLLTIFCFNITLDAQAARFGGGKSFGFSRPASSFSKATPFQRNNQNQMNRTPSSMSRWLGPLAGIALGGMLASLFMGHGLFNGMLSWLLIIAVAAGIWQLLRNRRPASVASNAFNQTANQNPFTSREPFALNNTPNTTSTIPAEFNQTAFIRIAKSHFIRLQNAYDVKNMADIREFTTPEVFAEIQLQLAERGTATNYTEVVELTADLNHVEQQAGDDIASVSFTGTIKESPDASAQAFEETWHFKKAPYESQWKVAGVEQKNH
jgi:predicted lipid-binding transport protein (Tim44 family)